MADTGGQPGVSRAAGAKLAQARKVAQLLDKAFRVPGTNIRFGLDAIIGLIPGGGDLAGAAFSAWLILLGSRMGMPRHLLTRMVANVAIDTLGGSVPLIGDLFDVAWKSNSRNLELLEQFAGAPVEPGPIVSRTVVGVALAVILAMVIGGVWLAVIAVRALIGLAT